MDRRAFLATAGAVVPVPLVGCFGATTAGDDPEPGTTAGSPDTKPDADGPATGTAGNGSPDRPWRPSDPVADPDGVHHLLVENHTDTTEAAWIRVVREDGSAVVDGRYELPDGRGIRFENVAAWETTYTIDLAIDGEGVTSLEWYTEACGPDAEASGNSGSRNAAVRVENATGDAGEDRISLVVDRCDALFAPDVPVGPAETFRLDG